MTNTWIDLSFTSSMKVLGVFYQPRLARCYCQGISRSEEHETDKKPCGTQRLSRECIGFMDLQEYLAEGPRRTHCAFSPDESFAPDTRAGGSLQSLQALENKTGDERPHLPSSLHLCTARLCNEGINHSFRKLTVRPLLPSISSSSLFTPRSPYYIPTPCCRQLDNGFSEILCIVKNTKGTECSFLVYF